jgi:hypothetical protein
MSPTWRVNVQSFPLSAKIDADENVDSYGTVTAVSAVSAGLRLRELT